MRTNWKKYSISAANDLLEELNQYTDYPWRATADLSAEIVPDSATRSYYFTDDNGHCFWVEGSSYKNLFFAIANSIHMVQTIREKELSE